MWYLCSHQHWMREDGKPNRSRFISSDYFWVVPHLPHPIIDCTSVNGRPVYVNVQKCVNMNGWMSFVPFSWRWKRHKKANFWFWVLSVSNWQRESYENKSVLGGEGGGEGEAVNRGLNILFVWSLYKFSWWLIEQSGSTSSTPPAASPAAQPSALLLYFLCRPAHHCIALSCTPVCSRILVFFLFVYQYP